MNSKDSPTVPLTYKCTEVIEDGERTNYSR